MRVIPPLTITDALLTDASAPEDPTYGSTVAEYAAGTTYALDEKAWSGTVGSVINVYRSLQAGNIGNTPASSPDWWSDLGETYSIYGSGVTYALGDIVINITTHEAYESLQAANLNHDPTLAASSAWWLSLGPTNRWAMFDQIRNTQTVGPTPLTVIITPGERINSVALSGILAESARVLVTSVSGGGGVFDSTQDLTSRQVLNWYDYFFLPFVYKPSTVFFDLPPYSDAIVYVQVSRSGAGNVWLGECVLGTYVNIGDVQYEAEDDVLNFSTITRNSFGIATLVKRLNVPKRTQTLFATKSQINTIRQLRDRINGVPAFWAGLNNIADDYFESMSVFGIYRRFVVNDKYPNHIIVSLELEEI